MMKIATPREMLTAWYMDWKNELEINRQKQADLRDEETKLLDLVATCERAFTTLFPEGDSQ